MVERSCVVYVMTFVTGSEARDGAAFSCKGSFNRQGCTFRMRKSRGLLQTGLMSGCAHLLVQQMQAAQGRLKALDRDLGDLKKRQAELTRQWEDEREDMQRLQRVKEEVERVNLEIQAVKCH